MKPIFGFFYILVFCFLNTNTVFSQSATEKIICSQPSPQIEFGISSLNKALQTYDGDVKIILSKLSDIKTVRSIEKSGIKVNTNLESEGFQIAVSKDKTSIAVLALDDAGLMYGAFELAEQLMIAGVSAVQNTFQNPYMKMRGTKFNIPLDVRTPSYSDVCDAAQKNMLEMWNFDFWKEYIDTLARYRYNYISLWSMHPFPSLVKVPEYPDVALDDVRQSTVNWKENYSLNGHLFNETELFENTKVIKKISIDEKIEFWKKVMIYGKERNVDIYFLSLLSLTFKV